MHSTLFKLVQNALQPYEFAVSRSPVDVGDGTVGGAALAQFLCAVAAYLAQHRLADQLSLEVREPGEGNGSGSKYKNEFEVQWGADPNAESFTVVLPRTARGGARDLGALTPTSWYVVGTPGSGAPSDPDPEQPGTHYEKIVARPKKETHKVIVTGGGGGDSSSNRSAALLCITPPVVLNELANLGLIAAAA